MEIPARPAGCRQDQPGTLSLPFPLETVTRTSASHYPSVAEPWWATKDEGRVTVRRQWHTHRDRHARSSQTQSGRVVGGREQSVGLSTTQLRTMQRAGQHATS